MRTKQISIANGLYWIAYSEGVKIAMREQYGVDCDDKDSFATAMRDAGKRLGLVHNCIVYGTKWAKLTGMPNVMEPPTLEDFSALVDQFDLVAVFPDLEEVMAGERTVVAKPSKKSKAGV